MVLAAAVLPVASAVAQGPAGDSVTGFGAGADQCGGTVCFRFVDSFDAHSGPSGELPTGSVEFALEGLHPAGGRPLYRGNVVCLTVSGNRATVGIELTFVDSVVPASLGDGVLYNVEDDGVGQDSTRSEILAAPPTACPLEPTGTLTPISDGDITVVDAPALPTSKAQCKNGGWRNYPGFKNQGQCVVFVLKTRQ